MTVKIVLGDDSAIVKALASLILEGAEKTRLLDQVGGSIADDNRLRFGTQASPEGVPWAQSWRARNQGGETLRDTGRLMNSITQQVSGDTLFVGTDLGYAAALHFGATIKPKAGKFLKFGPAAKPIFKKQVVLPARPFLGVNAQDESNALEVINNFFLSKL